jgi:O-succinylbenzoate synthase
MSVPWPTVSAFLDGAVAYRIRLVVPFRGLTEREGLLVRGPSGWGEFAPFDDYDTRGDARWLASAVEAAWGAWPAAVRQAVPVNAIVPAVVPEQARRIAAESGCSTVKVKVAQVGQQLADDVARVRAVREALGPTGRVRIDANGAWSVNEAAAGLDALQEFDLEYVEQPCATVAEMRQLRQRTTVPLAVDEVVRRAPDPARVAGVSDAADVIVLKVAPLGGVSAALDVAAAYGLPVAVSSALESSVGLGAGAALAAALPELRFACGLGTQRLLVADVVDDPLVPVDGVLSVRRAEVAPSRLVGVRAPFDRQQHWTRRATVAFEEWMARRDGGDR